MRITSGVQEEHVRAILAGNYSEVYANHDQLVQLFATGDSFSLFREGESTPIAVGVIAAGGLTGTAWVMCSGEVERCPVASTLAIRRFIRKYMEARLLVKLSTVVEVNSVRNLAWAKALGFKVEGVSMKHDGKRDYYYMGLIADGR